MLCYASPTMGSLVSSTNRILWSGASSNLWVALVVEWEKNRANCGFDVQVPSNDISEEVLQSGG